MKYIYLTFFSIIATNALLAQTYIKGSLFSTGGDVVVTVRPTADVVRPTAVATFNVVISVAADGLPIGSAPVPTPTSAIAGTVVDALPIFILDDRWVYTYIVSGNVIGGINWPGNVSRDLLSLDFPVSPLLSGKFPRLEDETNNGGGPSSQSYWFADFDGVDYTDYADFFYSEGGAIFGNDSDGDQWVQSFSALPVKIKSFSAVKHSERSAKLDWITSSEQNSDYFSIERSKDGSDWETIGRVKAAGNSNTDLAYSFIDDKLPMSRTNDNIFYYRLLTVDLDGKSAYSDIKGVVFNRTQFADITVFPNPTYDVVNIDLNNIDFNAGSVSLQVYDSAGKQVVNRKVSGTGLEIVDLSQLPVDAYQFIVRQGEILHQQKVIKVH